MGLGYEQAANVKKRFAGLSQACFVQNWLTLAACHWSKVWVARLLLFKVRDLIPPDVTKTGTKLPWGGLTRRADAYLRKKCEFKTQHRPTTNGWKQSS